MYRDPPDCGQPSAGTVQTAAETSDGDALADAALLATGLPETLALPCCWALLEED